jgi:colanic acid/amylovoran biosynthesis glycosyltransferase
MPSVLFVMPNWEAPSEVFLRQQMRMLADARLLEAIILPYNPRFSPWHGIPVLGLVPQKRLRKQIIHRLKRKIGLKSPTLGQRFRNVVHQTQADTILIQYATLAVELQQVLETLPHRLFIHVHGGDVEHWHDEDYRRSLLQLSQRATIIHTSQEVLARLKAWGIEERRCVIKPYGCPVPDSAPARIPSDEVMILHIGRLIDCKSPDRTIQAFELACEQGLRGRLVLVGDGPLMTMCQLLRTRSRWRDQIELPGAISDADVLAQLRAQAAIFTQHAIKGELTGQVEAFGLSIVEAMAAALPVVTCPVGGIKETVVDGETGIMITPGSVEEQAAAFLRLARAPHLRAKMGHAGWQRAATLYSIEIEKQRLMTILSTSEM